MKSGWIFRSRIVKAMLPLREIVWQIKEQRERERERNRGRRKTIQCTLAVNAEQRRKNGNLALNMTKKFRDDSRVISHLRNELRLSCKSFQTIFLHAGKLGWLRANRKYSQIRLPWKYSEGKHSRSGANNSLPCTSFDLYVDAGIYECELVFVYLLTISLARFQ